MVPCFAVSVLSASVIVHVGYLDLIAFATAAGSSAALICFSVSSQVPSSLKFAEILLPSNVNSASHSFASSLPQVTKVAPGNFFVNAFSTAYTLCR